MQAVGLPYNQAMKRWVTRRIKGNYRASQTLRAPEVWGSQDF